MQQRDSLLAYHTEMNDLQQNSLTFIKDGATDMAGTEQVLSWAQPPDWIRGLLHQLFN